MRGLELMLGTAELVLKHHRVVWHNAKLIPDSGASFRRSEVSQACVYKAGLADEDMYHWDPDFQHHAAVYSS